MNPLLDVNPLLIQDVLEEWVIGRVRGRMLEVGLGTGTGASSVSYRLNFLVFIFEIMTNFCKKRGFISSSALSIKQQKSETINGILAVHCIFTIY